MGLERPFLTFFFPLAFIACGLVYASFQVTPQRSLSHLAPLSEIARIIQTDGNVDLSRFHTSNASLLPTGKNLDIPIHHLDTIRVHARSSAVLSFLDGYELLIKPHSQIVLEYWNPDDIKQPVSMNLIKGDYKVLKKGRRGSVFIVSDGQLFSPELKPKTKVRTLALHISSKTLQHSAKISVKNKPQTAPQGSRPVPSASEAHSIKTLTNEYIDQVIASHREQFVKCQTHAVREKKPAIGNILMGLSIDPRGRMSDIQVLNSNIENEELHKCLTSVFQRTKFKPFDGPEIVRSYPLIFE